MRGGGDRTGFAPRARYLRRSCSAVSASRFSAREIFGEACSLGDAGDYYSRRETERDENALYRPAVAGRIKNTCLLNKYAVLGFNKNVRDIFLFFIDTFIDIIILYYNTFANIYIVFNNVETSRKKRY